MPLIAVNCPHVDGHGDLAVVEDVISKKETFDKCLECNLEGPNLWLCLYPGCRYVGCAEQHCDHSTIHNSKFVSHSAHMNLSTNRIWCYSCQAEIHTKNVNESPSQCQQQDTWSDLLSSFNKSFGDASINMESKEDKVEFMKR